MSNPERPTGFGRGRGRFPLPPSGDEKVQGPAAAAHAPIPPVSRGRGSLLSRPQAIDPQLPVQSALPPSAVAPIPPLSNPDGSGLPGAQMAPKVPSTASSLKSIGRGRIRSVEAGASTQAPTSVPSPGSSLSSGLGRGLIRQHLLAMADGAPSIDSAIPNEPESPSYGRGRGNFGGPSSGSERSSSGFGRGRLVSSPVQSVTEDLRAVSLDQTLDAQPDSGLESQRVGNVVHPSQARDSGPPSQSGATSHSGKARSFLSDTTPKAPVVDKGTDGTPTTVGTNYIRLKFLENKGVFHYILRFNPSVDDARARYNLVRQKLPIKKGIRCYDGGDILYLPERLEEDEMTLSCIHPNDGSPIEMKVQFKRKLRMGECCPLLGTLIQSCTRELKLTRLGRQSYNHNSAQHIPQHKIQIWPGYVTAVEEREDGVFLTCDLLHRVLRFETCHSLLEALQYRGGDVTTLALKELVGCTVLTHYNNRLYRVDDILWELTPLSEFKLKDGSKVSFRDYYKQQYNLDIKDLKQPMLLSKPKKLKEGNTDGQEVVLVPELCHMTGITDKMRSDFRVMKDIAMYTRLTPQQRNDGLRTFIESLKANENVQNMLHEWGLEVPDDAAKLPARVMPSVDILFGNKRSVKGNADWGRGVRSNPVFRGVDITRWFLIFHQKDARRAESFTRMMLGTAQGMGVRVEKPVVLTLTTDRVDQLMATLRSNVTPDTQAVVVLMSAQREDVYSAIKRFCSHERPVASQVVLSQTLAKEEKMRPIVQNIALQMEAKLGGALWAVPTPLKRTMVCGIDVYHDKGDQSSVGAFVASMDDMFTQYMSIATQQKAGVELVDSIFKSLVCALSEWYPLHQGLPDRIIVYRDGVEEGGMRHMLEHEVDQFLVACRTYCPSYSPKIVYIMVLKRIAARFFSLQGSRMENALPGTVVDHTVTKRNFRDFLIVSQLVRHGCAAPTHYVVLRDDANMPIDRIQRMTYFFCHMYYNWPGTVRVPAPCLYAHKLAGLVGQYIRRVPDPSLNNRLHYL